MGFLQTLYSILQPAVLLYLTIGSVIGFIVGALPGLSCVMALAILTPLTFWLPPDQGLAMLIGVFNSAIFAGGITAVLINTPGTPASIISTFDGYAMTKRGEAGLALGINTIYSVIGGLFGSLVLLFFAFPLAKFSLKFGPPEYFALSIFGLSMIIAISGGNILKGIIIGCVGLMLSTIGMDPVLPIQRYVFGNLNLMNGISFIPIMIGLFGLGEVFKQIYDNEKQIIQDADIKVGRLLPTWKQVRQFLPSSILSAIISVIVGAIPGTGAEIAQAVSYDQSKKISKHPEEYGKGSAEGLASSCLANNAMIGGAMTTMMSLGIPGDEATAVLLGALFMYGLVPGPRLFIEHKALVDTIIGLMIGANVIILFMGLLTAKASIYFLKIKNEILWIIVSVLCIIGSYAINNSLFDVWVMVISGILGFLLSKMEFPITPVILALILGPMAETNLRRTISMNGTYLVFFTRPISLIFVILTFLSLFGPFIKRGFKKYKKAKVN